MYKSDVDPGEVVRRMRDGDDPFVLDVRNEDDYEKWQVRGSHNLPIYDELLDADFSTLADHLDDLPTDEEIVTVCVAGITSAAAAEFLRDRGYDARSMTDGMNGWGRLHCDYEVESTAGVVQIVRPGTGCLSYLVHDDAEAVVVDPSQYVDRYLSAAADRELEIVAVVDTHAHADHVSGARRLAGDLDVPYYLHPDDAGDLDRYAPLEEGDAIGVGGRELTALHTPGHTPGSASLRVGDALLAGDTLFLGGVGRPDLEGSEETEVRAAATRLYDSLGRLLDLPEETVVLPAHFDDREDRPLATELGALREENDLLSLVDAGEEDEFVDAVVEELPDEPGNYNRIKAINRGEEQPADDVESLELGPNNCATG